MRWRKGRRSKNVIDARGRRRKGAAVGGGAVILALLAAVLFGQDPGQVLQQIGAGQPQTSQGQAPTNPQEEEIMDFLRVVLADTEDVWGKLFREANSTYRQPQFEVFRGVTQTACGLGQSASGPFYCPGDSKLYMDLSFLGELRRMGASGDFALAYVVAHEVGHHIQNLTGRAMEVQRAKQRMRRADANALQVKMELEADCYAGVWAHHAHRQRNILESGDVEEGLRAAASVGDDHLQRQATGRVVPESFTHGTSEQRMTWFRRGLDSGSVAACDTFR